SSDEGSYYLGVTNDWGAAKSAPFNIRTRKPIFTSTWNRLDPEIPAPDWRGIAFGNGRFVAVGGTNNALVSSDTTNWLPSTIGSTGVPTAIAFDSQSFVAVSSTGEIFLSADAMSWQKEAQVPFPLTCLAVSRETVVAGGQAGNFAVRAGGK